MPDEQLKELIKSYIFGSDHPDLQVYRKDFGTKFDLDHWLAAIRRRCELGRFKNKKILEVGCGFGWDAVGISLVGNNRVVATDILQSMIDGTNECLATMRSNGTPLDVEPLQGDICELNLPDASFDGIYSSEAIEHVHDLNAMFSRCHALLKPGGRMIIFNDSNRFNSEFRESTFEMWEQRDASWEHAKWLETEVRPVEHKGAKPYAAMREKIIRETAPGMDQVAVHKLASATAGLVRAEILLATEDYLNCGRLPVPPEFSWCRNPETGEYAERLLDPFELRNMLTAQGFRDVKLRHAFSRFPFRLVNSIRFRPINQWLFDKRGMFVLVADK